MDYLVIGHITRDETPQGPMLGGTSSYAAVTAARLGAAVGLVARVGGDCAPLDLLRGIELCLHKDERTTTFENLYFDGKRVQKLYAVSRDLEWSDVPEKWRRAPVVHLAPIAQEFGPGLREKFTNHLVGATLQGWLRGRDESDRVTFQPHPDLEAWLPHLDVAIMSEEDAFGDRELMQKYLGLAKLGVETRGREGCLIYCEGTTTPVPVVPVEELDPTGAGDIFAAAFLIRYRESGDFRDAARFANACASLSVSRVGVSGVPDREETEARMREICAKLG